MLDGYSIVSALQYYSAWYNFNQAIIYLASVPKYRIQVDRLLIYLASVPKYRIQVHRLLIYLASVPTYINHLIRCTMIET